MTQTKPESGKAALLTKFESFLDAVIGNCSPDKYGLPVLIKSNEEERIETSVNYMPDTLDAHGEWMNKSTVSDMRDRLHKGFLEDKNLYLNLWHDTNLLLPREECEVLSVELTKSEMFDDDGHYIPEGTCVMTVKYHNKRLWEMRKSGIIGGFSIHGKRDLFPGEGEA